MLTRKKETGRAGMCGPVFNDLRKLTICSVQTQAAARSMPNVSAPNVAVRPQQQNSVIAVSDRSTIATVG
jgi:hypothetical protein